ncbi:MAG: ABC transporter permease [Eubacteriales bacterium]|nr:ABC transporter permease [Eubacteriales bacterium]
MSGKVRTAFVKYGGCLAVWLLILIACLSGLKEYGKIQKTGAAQVFLSSHYPAHAEAGEILEKEQEMDDPSDLCFYWDGGIEKISEKEYGRSAQVLTAGVYGKAALYDWKLNGFGQEDKNGCVIDGQTAADLYGSTDAVGRKLQYQEQTYEVRQVLPWKQRVFLFHPDSSDTAYTKVFVEVKEGQTKDSAASQFLMRYSLSGTVIEGTILENAAFVMILLLPGIWFGMLLLYAVKERRKSKGKGLEYWMWTGACLMWVLALFLIIWKHVKIPVEWLPDKWSDLQFWPDKITEETEKLKLYVMLQKTVTQTENIFAAFRSMGYSLGACLLFLFYMIYRKRK